MKPAMDAPLKPKALEFFAGGGLVRLGLCAQFDVVWANDINVAKATSWTANFGRHGFVLGDIHEIAATQIPRAELAWASFPCQDLSLAGGRAGLSASRSGTFYRFVDVIKGLQALARAPKVLVIENVVGLLTSRGGQDFVALMQALSDLGYHAGALEIDARYFVPQSRPRVFIIACDKGLNIPKSLILQGQGKSLFVTPAILRAIAKLPDTLKSQHIYWSLPEPPKANQQLVQLVDEQAQDWWPQTKTSALIESLNQKHRDKLAAVQVTGEYQVGAVYRRTRRLGGIAKSFAEVRFDGLAGCLRTPSGGSSRQFLLFVDGQDIRVRALNPREALRLMGVPDTYVLPKGTLAGLKIAGDGVAVQVVAWLSERLLGPLVSAISPSD